jgi:hypothetical protein
MENVSSLSTHCTYQSVSSLYMYRACISFSFISELFLFPSSRLQITARNSVSVCLSLVLQFPCLFQFATVCGNHFRSLPVCSLRCHFLSSPRSEGLCCVIIDSRSPWQTLRELRCLYTASSASRQTARRTQVHTLQKHTTRSILQLAVFHEADLLLSFHSLSLSLSSFVSFTSFLLSLSVFFFLHVIFLRSWFLSVLLSCLLVSLFLFLLPFLISSLLTVLLPLPFQKVRLELCVQCHDQY